MLSYNNLENCKKGDTSHMVWKSPDGTSFTHTNRPIGYDGDWCLYTGTSGLDVLGTWEVEFYYNNKKMYADNFFLVDPSVSSSVTVEKHYMAACPYTGCESPAPQPKSTFYPSDCILNYNLVRNCKKGDTSHMVWKSPDGTSFTHTNLPIDYDGDWCLYTWNPAGTIPDILGTWSVEFYYNDNKIYTDNFFLRNTEVPVLKTKIARTNLILSWTEVTDALGYEIYYAPTDSSGNPDSTKINHFYWDQASFRINLVNNIHFFLAVRADMGQEKTGFSNIEEISIQPKAPTGWVLIGDSGFDWDVDAFDFPNDPSFIALAFYTLLQKAGITPYEDAHFQFFQSSKGVCYGMCIASYYNNKNIVLTDLSNPSISDYRAIAQYQQHWMSGIAGSISFLWSDDADAYNDIKEMIEAGKPAVISLRRHNDEIEAGKHAILGYRMIFSDTLNRTLIECYDPNQPKEITYLLYKNDTETFSKSYISEEEWTLDFIGAKTWHLPPKYQP